MSINTVLVKYDAMCRAIDAAYEVDEVKGIRDKAFAVEAYARQAKNTEAERRACEIRLRAERKTGQLLSQMEKGKGGRPKNSQQPAGSLYADVKRDSGITDGQGERWQALAGVPEEEFEAALAAPKKPSTSGIIREQKPVARPIPDTSLWLWGRLRDFERDGYF